MESELIRSGITSATSTWLKKIWVFRNYAHTQTNMWNDTSRFLEHKKFRNYLFQTLLSTFSQHFLTLLIFGILGKFSSFFSILTNAYSGP